MSSVWNRHIPLRYLLAASVLLSAAPAVFIIKTIDGFKKYVKCGILCDCAVVLFSLVFVAVLRKRIITEALAVSGLSQVFYLKALLLLGAGLLLALFFLLLLTALKSFAPAVRLWLKSLNKSDLIFLAAALVAMNVLAWLYVKYSYKVYYWDSAGYWRATHALADTARQGFLHYLSAVYQSILTQDYNDLIAVPWTPLVLLFGTSRWVFVCGIVNFGLFPLVALIYFYICGVCKRRFLAVLCLLAAFPMVFYTALVGFIDVTGVFFILSALLLWMSDKNKNDLGRFIVTGLFLAAAVLLRRWYAFFACSFVLALIVDSLLFRRSWAPVLGVLASFGFSLLFQFQPFVSGVLMKNVSQLYSAYKLGLAFDFNMFFHYFGVFSTAVAVLTGVYACFRREKRQTALFLLIQMVSCFVIFVSVQSHNQQHLLLYVPSLVLLMSMLVCPLADALTKRRAAGILLAVNTLLPSVVTIGPALQPPFEKSLPVALLPAFSFKPQVWPDANETVNIIRYLDEAVGAKGKTVGLLASSFTLNRDILLNAEDSLNMARISDVDRTYLYSLPEVDSRDPFPGSLFACDYLLVADPIQLHLGEEKQKCIDLPAKALLRHTGIGAAYAQTGETFYMDGGKTQIMLFEKTRELTETEKSELLNAYKESK